MGKRKMRFLGSPWVLMVLLSALAVAQSMGYPFAMFFYMAVLAHFVLVQPIWIVGVAVTTAHVVLGAWVLLWLGVFETGLHILLLLGSTLAMGLMAGMVRRFDSLKAGLESGILAYSGLGLIFALTGNLQLEALIMKSLPLVANGVSAQTILREPVVQELVLLYDYSILALFWLRGVLALLLAYGLSSMRVQKGGLLEVLQHLRLHGGFAVLLAGLALLQFYWTPEGVLQSFLMLPVVVLSLFGLMAAHFATRQGALGIYGLGTLYLLLLLPGGLGLFLVGFIGVLDAFYNLRRDVQFDLKQPGQWVETFCSLRMKRNALWA